MKEKAECQQDNRGFTLVEVLISILILSIITSAAVTAFVHGVKVSKENKLAMTALNLANETVEYIRSLKFADIGTKVIIGGSTIYGDPAGEILQTETKTVGGMQYTIQTTISWEEQGGWDLGDTDWDYKSIRVTACPKGMESDPKLTKVIETYVTRDSTQPALTGANFSLRVVRGWTTTPGVKEPVSNVKVKLVSGPSAPRQVQTSSAGVARFINLTPGTYSITIDSSALGLMLLPNQIDDWTNYSITNGLTAAKEFSVEHPCTLRIMLKDLDGNPMVMDAGDTGSVAIDVPYGTAINKTFTSDMLDSQGRLPFDFITGLWPVGDGYTGAYTVTNISIPESRYFGSFVTDGGPEEAWNGKFDAPGTMKEITCYFGTIPVTPGDIATTWVDSGGYIPSDANSYTSMDTENVNIYLGKFASINLEETIIMSDSSTVNFNATEIYFENVGNASNPGLYIGSQSNLILHTGLVVFRGEVEYYNHIDSLNIGRITLSTTYEDGSSATYIDGGLIGGTEGVNYGKLYLAKPMTLDGTMVKEAGSYYFPDGLKLPDNPTALIPITKDNYIP